MVHPRQDDSHRYLTEVVKLNMSLDGVLRRRDPRRITRALITGKEQYFDLVFRRLRLDFRSADAAVVLWMLDLIHERLAALARLQYQKSLPPGVPDRLKTGLFILNG